METHHPVPGPSEIFVQGFAFRLIYGLAGLGALALVNAGAVARITYDQWWVIPVYLGVCVTGGIRDSRAPGIAERRLFTTITRKPVLWAAFWIALVSSLVLGLE